MADRVGHLFQDTELNRLLAPRFENTANPTHSIYASISVRADRSTDIAPGSSAEYSRLSTSSPFFQFIVARPMREAFEAISLQTAGSLKRSTACRIS